MKTAFIYTTDAGGFDLVRYSAVSLALSQREPCDIHVFCYRFVVDPADRLHAALTKLGGTLFVHSIAAADLEQHETCGHVTKPVLLRLRAVDQLVEQYDRVVCLDNDIMVHGDLAIDRLQFRRFPVAAVIDMDVSPSGPVATSGRTMAEVGAGGPPDYFNAGFLIFDAANWRSAEFQSRYAAELQRHDVSCDFRAECTSIDQCALNIVFADRWLVLPPGYNMQATAKFTSGWQDAKVRHYCGRRKVVPVSLFRNDGRDVAYLNRIRPLLGQPAVGSPFLYDVFFRLNVARKYFSGRDLRHFLRAAGARSGDPRCAVSAPAAAGPSFAVERSAPAEALHPSA